MTGATEPGAWTRVNRSASGKSSANTSRQRSPPRMPVSQSWTSATRTGVARRSARGGPDPLPPVVEELDEGALEGNRRLPAEGPLDLRRIALEDHHVGRAEAGGIDPDGDPLHRGLLQKEVQHLLDRPRPPRAKVVHLAGLAPLEEEPVPADDVAHVGEVAAGLEVADVDGGFAQSGLDLRYLLGEVGGDEHVAPPRTLVAERARANDGQTVALEVLVAHHVLGDLAHRVGRQGPQRVGLAD